MDGHIQNIVTAPIDKHSVQNTDFDFRGHTEFFAKKFEIETYMMLMVSDEMKIGMVTTHIPVNQISESINADLIISKAQMLKQSLEEDFLIKNPKIAVLGLNPHSGDNGLIGKEEQEVLIPVIDQLQNDMHIFATRRRTSCVKRNFTFSAYSNATGNLVCVKPCKKMCIDSIQSVSLM